MTVYTFGYHLSSTYSDLRDLGSFRWKCWISGCQSPEFPPDYLEPESMDRDYIGCIRCSEVEGAMFDHFLPKRIWSRILIALRHNWIHKHCRKCPSHVWFTNDEFCSKAREEARLHAEDPVPF